MKKNAKVLFLCTENSCRSQMAEGLLKYKSNGEFDVSSAGSHPDRVHPDAIKIMEEINIDISKQTSNHIDEFIQSHIDVLIIVCDNANRCCPAFPAEVRRLHWNIENPSLYPRGNALYMKNFRKIRTELSGYIEIFLESFGRT
jgi:arsenate reductase